MDRRLRGLGDRARPRHGRGAFSPSSGFHHADWNRCGAFCTFNGFGVAAQALRAVHPDARVAILDCGASGLLRLPTTSAESSAEARAGAIVRPR